jgi:hypothetical protein
VREKASEVDRVVGGNLTIVWGNLQAIAVGNKTHAKTPVFKIDSAEITCDEVVKLLGIDIDYQLNFNYRALIVLVYKS